MVMKRNYLILKYIKLISFISVVMYGVHPLINGIGCDYHSQTEDEKRSLYTTCKFGIINSVGLDKETKEIFKYSGLYGKSGGTIFFYVYKKESLNKKEGVEESIISKLNSSQLYIAHVFEGDEHDWIIIQYPYYNVYMARRVGVMGIF